MAFFTSKFCCYKETQDLERELYSQDARAETEHVAVVVLARLMRGIRVATKRRANAAEFVRCDRSANTTAAHQNADLRGAPLHRFADLFCVIGIIVGYRAVVSAKVDDFVAGAAQFFDHSLIERVSTVICADCNPHLFSQSQQLTRVGQHVLHVEPQLAQRHLARRRSAEPIQTNYRAVSPNVPIPPEANTRLNRESCSNSGR
jgi:hypothetical protein